MRMRFEQATPLVVLRNHFGELPSREDVAALSLDQIEELGELLVMSANASVHEDIGNEIYYAGGWLGSGWHEPVFKQELLHALLYYPRVLVHDPLADFFSGGVARLPEYQDYRSTDRPPLRIQPLLGDASPVFEHVKDQPENAARRLSTLIANMVAVAPLIDAGILILRSQWPTLLQRLHPVQTSVRQNLRTPAMVDSAEEASGLYPPPTLWDNRRGMNVVPPNGVYPADRHLLYQQDFFYLAKTLAIADQSSARYVPQTEADYRLLAAYAERLPEKTRNLERPPGRVLEEVSRLVVPSMSLDAKKMVSLRQDEESFEDWRLSLRNLARAGAEDNDNDLAQRVEEELKPRIHTINRNLSRRKTVGDIVPNGIDVAVSAGIGGGGAVPGLSGALKWLYNTLKKPSPGHDTVLARLVHHNLK